VPKLFIERGDANFNDFLEINNFIWNVPGRVNLLMLMEENLVHGMIWQDL
jgi:hypothetical protein